MKKKAIILHSGGFDSSLCLALAKKEFSSSELLSLSFQYGQRHVQESKQAEKICKMWGIDHAILSIDYLSQITTNALINPSMQICKKEESSANTLVVGRNGLMARLAAIYADHLDVSCLYMGVIQDDAMQNGYRDCSREYMDLKQQILRIDLANPAFEIRTPLVHLTKREAMELALEEGVLDFLLRETISCYEGVMFKGCMQCPACLIRNRAIESLMNSPLSISHGMRP